MTTKLAIALSWCIFRYLEPCRRGSIASVTNGRTDKQNHCINIAPALKTGLLF